MGRGRVVTMIVPSYFVLASVAVVVAAGWSSAAGGEELRVKDLPMPAGARDITIMKRRGDVRFMVDTDFKTTGNFYAKKLAELKWAKSGKDNLQRNFWVQKFTKDEMALEVRVDSRRTGSEVRLTPTGLMWEEDDQPSPKDLPLPKDATDIVYDDFFESIKLRSPSNVKTVAEMLSKELIERKWSKVATDIDHENFVRLRFTYDKSLLEIDIRADESGVEVAGSEIAIRTEGMQWDEVKAEIARTKEQAKKIAEKASPEKAAADAIIELPPRKDKPKQGIAKLLKLPNAGTVVMNGKTYALSNVIAFETFEDGQWLTKVVATQRPIKQAALVSKLRKTGYDWNREDGAPGWPQPYLQLELNDDDRPEMLWCVADGTPGGNREIKGTALVEDGRVRGTAKLEKPGHFFSKEYTGEISFDVPLLTRYSTPAKRLMNAPRLANGGTLTVGRKTYKLPNVVAYRTKFFEFPVTAIVFTERPLDLAQLKAALADNSEEEYSGFVPQVKLLVDEEDRLLGQTVWAENRTYSAINMNLPGEFVIEDGRVRGSAKSSDSEEPDRYSFAVSCDLDLTGELVSAFKTSDSPGNVLVAETYEGLLVPRGHKVIQIEETKFRSELQVTAPAALDAVVAFYRRELPTIEWKENAQEAKLDKQTAKLSFSGPQGSLILQLKGSGNETAIALSLRDTVGAKAVGVLPSAGKSRIVIGNKHDEEVTVTINKQAYKVAAGASAEDPKNAANWEVTPGNYAVEIEVVGKKARTAKLTIGADESWSVIILPSGTSFVVQLF